jgi:hypothetical protein
MCPVDFSPDERIVYDNLRQQTIRNIDEAVSGHHGSSRPSVYTNTLQRIESLRLFFDLELQYHARHKTQNDPEWSSIAQQAFNFRRGIEPLICMQCSLSVDFNQSLLDGSSSSISAPQFTSCMKFVCGECARKLSRDQHAVRCGHNPACLVASVSTGGDAFEETVETLSKMPLAPMRLSSKVEALITDLKSLPPDTKW